MAELTHLNADGHAHMVAVTDKPETERGAIARASVRMSAEAFLLLQAGELQKGDAIQVARIAAIQAAKRTSELIPLCHPVRLVSVEVSVLQEEHNSTVHFDVRAQAIDRTGVEMEAMTGAAVAALTLYDMIKGVDRAAVITSVHLLEKWGGRSGRFSPQQDR